MVPLQRGVYGNIRPCEQRGAVRGCAGLGTAGRNSETSNEKPQPPEVALMVTKFADDTFNAPVLTNKLSSILKGVRAEHARQHDFGNYQPTFTLS